MSEKSKLENSDIKSNIEPEYEQFDTLDALEAIQALQLEIENQNILDSNLRKKSYVFYTNKLHVVLNKEDSLKGCRECLKLHLNGKRYQHMCKLLNIAHVEKTLEIHQGSWSLTVLLMFYNYEEHYWPIIYRQSGKIPLTKNDFKKLLDTLS